MSGTAKTVLIVGGVAAGAFVLFKLIAPSGPAIKAPPANANTLSLKGITGLASALGSFLGGGSGGGSGGGGGGGVDSSDAYSRQIYSTPASQAALAGLRASDSVTVTDNFIYTDPNGDFIAG